MTARKLLASISVVIAGAIVLATPAAAKCTRLGFSVNDYGKDGPTKDAKDLLDKYVANWAAQRGIKNYRTGKKDVKCDLFLDFIVFDEYTCRAEATVCWGDGQPAGGTDATAPAAPSGKKAPPAATAPAAPATAAPAKAPAPAKKKADQQG